MFMRYGIYTTEGQPVMRGAGNRIAPVTFTVVGLYQDSPILEPIVERRYNNLCSDIGIDPDEFTCKDVTFIT